MVEDPPHEETVDELRKRLNEMKRMMAERRMTRTEFEGNTMGESRNSASGVIDGNFLSWVFGVALLVIVTVSVYAFYNLYHAILKKFPTHHTEL
ncbi:hypothetical protein PPYR_05625 [Photinus pyralis]|uniref:Uncharacterized protein n=1 Tax=Photinus pyralis TaxID=7054 RepID=A0A5N4AVA0_PHOPY|nr:hypothetical protein PPYR_05625 [Photinus pyralis]